VESIFSDIVAVAPEVATLVLLATFVLHVMRQNAIDERTHNRLVSSIQEQHQRDMSNLRDDIAALRLANHELLVELENARRARWEAEDTTAIIRREIGPGDE
jgi:hypothetical protein